MTEEKLKNLLAAADRAAGPPAPVSITLAAVTRRRTRHKLQRLTAVAAAAVAVIIAGGLWHWTAITAKTNEQNRIARLESDLRRLQVQSDATVKVINDLLEHSERQQRMARLQAKLAAIGDPIAKANEEVETAAFIIVYQADRKWQQFSQTKAAIDDYNTVLKLFPQTRSAKTAKERLAEIQNDSTSPKTLEGDML